MKVFAYLRVSTDKQDFQQQRNAINAFLATRNLAIDEVVTDEGVSGGVTYKKRNLYHLIQDMSEGDVLVVSEVSRLGRSMSDLNKLVNDEMKPKKLRLVIIGMGLDLDCANLKAIDEMVLFAFSFGAQLEKEMIQERTKNALEARKKQIEEIGYYVNKKGVKRTKLGGGAMSVESRERASETRRKKAYEDGKNQFFAKFVHTYEARCGKLTANSGKEHFEQIANELNSLGFKTHTGLEYTAGRVRALWVRMKEREYLDD